MQIPVLFEPTHSQKNQIQNKNANANPNLTRVAPARSVDDDAHEAARDDTSDGEGDEPAEVDPADHAPVDGAPGARAETDTDGGTSDALGGRDGKLEAGGKDDSDGRAKLHGETTGWRLEGEAVTQVPHDVIAISPDAEDEHGSAEAENPGGNGSLVTLGEHAGVPDLEDGGIGTDGVGDVVGTVGERGSGGSHDLEEAVHVLGLVVVASSVGVNLLDITGEGALLASKVDNILIDTVEESPLDTVPNNGQRVPLAFGSALEELLVGLAEVGGLLAADRGSGAVARSTIGGVGGANSLLGERTGGRDLDITTLGGLGGGELILGADLLDRLILVLVVGVLRDGAAAEEEETERNVVPAELPVVEHDNAVEPGHQSDAHEEGKTDTDGNNDTGELGISELDLVVATLPEKQHGKERGGETEVDWHVDEGLPDGVLAKHDAILGDQEDDGGEDSGETRGDDPGEEDLNDTRVDGTSTGTLANPLDTWRSQC